MSADFWAGYISGAVGIMVGNPFDIVKVQLQAAVRKPSVTTSSTASLLPSSFAPSPSAIPASPLPRPSTATGPADPPSTPRPPPRNVLSRLVPSTFSGRLAEPLLAYPLAGVAAPILGYGALNALLFVSYNRTESFLNSSSLFGTTTTTTTTTTAATWLAGAVAGLATWVVSTPTELVKCRAQLGNPSHSSWAVARQVWRAEGLRGLYFGGAVTALRDSVGYGFYFWTYALLTRKQADSTAPAAGGGGGGGVWSDAAAVLGAGGLSGIATWASIYPLDVIKTRVQAQVLDAAASHPHTTSSSLPPLASTTTSTTTSSSSSTTTTPLLSPDATTPRRRPPRRMGAWEVYRQAVTTGGGYGVLFRGLTVCCVRAFLVNAVQWGVYEWVMMQLGQGRWDKPKAEPVV